MSAVEERIQEILYEIAHTDTWDRVRYRQGYIQAMEDLTNLIPDREETQ